jgi:hypothetical protein
MQGISLTMRYFLHSGDWVIVESPTWYGELTFPRTPLIRHNSLQERAFRLPVPYFLFQWTGKNSTVTGCCCPIARLP